MTQNPQFPLLRLDAPAPSARKKGSSRFTPVRKFSRNEQGNRAPGQELQRLAQFVAGGGNPLELLADPSGIAPERLLVFELTGSVQSFARAALRVPGLELVASADLDTDEDDDNPTLYMLVSDAEAFRQMLSLWTRFRAGGQLPRGFAPWRDLFSQLRDIRPWGPQDRVSKEDRLALGEEVANAAGLYRVELELVFRNIYAPIEAAAVTAVEQAGGIVISRCRIDGAKYHALLVDIPAGELARILGQENSGLIVAESVMHIRPQNAVHVALFEPQPTGQLVDEPLPTGDPIVGVFDGVPLAAHPRLQGRLSVDDPFNLDALAVGLRVHGTAMASAVIHGDLGSASIGSLSRRVYFLNMMFAPGELGAEERFPDRLPADLFHEAVVRMKEGAAAAAPGVIIVNVSLGDRNKPFMGRTSGWARVLDYLSYHYGVLFVVSAGNHLSDVTIPDVTTIAFEALDEVARAKSALKATGSQIGTRRILAPSESMNAITVGALHDDAAAPALQIASVFDLWRDTGLCTISSGLGPGIRNSTKPDILHSGGRHHVRLIPAGGGHILRPLNKGSASQSGVVVAAPPVGGNPDSYSRSTGTSVAAARTSGLAARAHEALEAAYEDFETIPGQLRAVLIKAMLVHGAKWTSASDMIAEVLGPSDPKQHVRQRDNIRRFLGFGAIDDKFVLDCATDRATLWGVGSLPREQGATFSIPLPQVMSGKAQPHEIAATLAWFAPPRIGVLNYRGVRLRLVEPDSVGSLGVSAEKKQPNSNQAHSGTVIHRRWSGSKAAVIGANSKLELMVQREPDELDSPIPFAFVVTITMPGIQEVYEQVRARVAIKPRIPIAP